MKAKLTAVATLALLLGGCTSDPYIYGPFNIGQAPTYENAMQNRYRPSEQRIIGEGQARAASVPDAPPQEVRIVRHDTGANPARGVRAGGGRSAW